LIDKIFRWLESIGDPFPTEQPDKPPDTLIGFLVHYSWPFWPLLLMSSVFSAIVALVEVYLFAFVGSLVDWLAASDPTTFWSQHKTQVMAMAVLVLVILPVLKFCYEAVIHQGLLGNFASRTRWQAHRYLLRQSLEFFQDDFAGRVATKMMQTALRVREVVLKLTEVLLYVGARSLSETLDCANMGVRRDLGPIDERGDSGADFGILDVHMEQAFGAVGKVCRH
jgi:ATP-binding cassette subfamily B multidrug efflux pump